MRIIEKPLTHFNERKSPIDMLVIHSMAHGVKDGWEALDKYNLSAHYIIGPTGGIYRCVDEKKRAWHAGVASWRGIDKDLNSHSIGIEVCHPTLGQHSFHKGQMHNLITLCQDIITRHNIKPEMIVGHSDIAPTRKPDPGKGFPWKFMADNGIGLWYGKEALAETNINKLLQTIGYETSTEDHLIASAYAFCRHFMPEKVISLPVEEVVETPYPKDNIKLLKDRSFIKRLQQVAYVYK